MKKFLITLVLARWGMSVYAYPIAGVNPSQRPEGAPTITEFPKSDNWYLKAVRGVVPPYPSSIRLMLLSQGKWYTPFSRPGMPRYDLRDLHGTGKLLPSFK